MLLQRWASWAPKLASSQHLEMTSWQERCSNSCQVYIPAHWRGMSIQHVDTAQVLTFLADNADRGVDLSAVQHVDSPTRDVLVIFDSTGDREFIGFGSAEANQFADCFISAAKLPEDTIRVSPSGFCCAGNLSVPRVEAGAQGLSKLP